VVDPLIVLDSAPMVMVCWRNHTLTLVLPCPVPRVPAISAYGGGSSRRLSVEPVHCRWRLGTALDGQTDSVKKDRIRLSVNPSAVARSERRSTARQTQSKRTEFVCPSSTRPLLLARNGTRQPARQVQSKRREFVCPSSTVRCRSLGTALDGQTGSVKKN
jgi:hypothetical protein